MINDGLAFVATSDLAGKTRGKAFPVAERSKREQQGVGWTPTNVQITCFDSIAETPFGAFGDVLLKPDSNAEVYVDFQDDQPPEHFFLGDIVELDGQPWPFCTRACLRNALSRLAEVGGVRLLAAFEHEFQVKTPIGIAGEAYGMRGYSANRPLVETLMAALRAAGLQPDTVMKEYGPDQYEVTIGPEEGLRSADAAVMVRELTRASALRVGQSATFTPIRDISSVGNGVHIHMSFLDEDGQPVTYATDQPAGLAPLTASFLGGVLKYIDAILAFTAPSAISYQRLTPHRWSAAFNNLGRQDREAAVRICPLFGTDTAAHAKQFNFEYRAADAAASPYLALAAIVHAGVQGVEEQLSAPKITEEDLSLLDAKELAGRGFVRLPQTLAEALQRLEATPVVKEWFGGDFVALYLDHKRGELEHLNGMSVTEQCALYEQIY